MSRSFVRRRPATFPILATLSLCAGVVILQWTGHELFVMGASLGLGHLMLLGAAAFCVAAAVALWRGAAWATRVMSAAWAMGMGIALILHLRQAGAPGLLDPGFWMKWAFLGGQAATVIVYVHLRLHPKGSLRQLLPDVRWK
jgi:hypothetical protein